MLEQKTLITALGFQSGENGHSFLSLEGIGDIAIKKTPCGSTFLQLACLKKPSLEEWEHLYRFFDDGKEGFSLPDGLSVYIGCTSFGTLCFHIFSASTEEQIQDILPILEKIVGFCKNGMIKRYA